MAHQQVSMALVLIIATILWADVTAQSSDCTNALISMSPCLNYISGNSSTPSSACCTQLDTAVRSQPQCLCQVLNGGGPNLGISINQTQALALPKACNVQTPPTSLCNAASPSGSPASTPNTPNTSSGAGSKTVPSTGDGVGTSDATPTKMTVSGLFFLGLVASYVLF